MEISELDFAELKGKADKFSTLMDAGAVKVARMVPGWVRWAIIGGIGLLAIFGLWAGWTMVFGSSVEAAKHSESLYQALMRYTVAFVVALASTAGGLIILTFALDPFTCRREFLEKVEKNEATDLSMAVFSIGTAIVAGAIFYATISALSV